MDNSSSRLKSCLLASLDLSVIGLFIMTLILLIIFDLPASKQPFLLLYIYLQLVALYLTFRLRHTNVFNVTVLFRFHLFNFLYSLFTLVNGYLEIIRSVNGEGLLTSNPWMFGADLGGLVAAHVVIFIYLCCPQVAMNE